MAPDRERRRLFVALVLTGRAGAEVDGLRRALQPALCARVAPHLTLVPPVNLGAAAAGDVSALLGRVAADEAPVRLALGPAATFLPRTPVVYLACADHDGTLAGLARRLSSGPLAPPPSRGRRPFVPHVTLANRVEPRRAPAVLEALGSFRLEVGVDALTLLEQEPHPPQAWQPVEQYAFGGRARLAVGGLAIELTVMARPDPEAARLVVDEAPGGLGSGEDLAVVARRAGALVGVGGGALGADALELRFLCVVPSRRSEGVGTRILAHLERHAAARNAPWCRAVVPAGGREESFLRGRGFHVAGVLAGWFAGRDGVALVHRLAPRAEGVQ